MITLLLEEVPKGKQAEELKKITDGSKDIDIVALTPLACYELDKVGFDYSFPEDYHYPERLNIKEVYDSFDFEENIIDTFILSLLETKETGFICLRNIWSKRMSKLKPCPFCGGEALLTCTLHPSPCEIIKCSNTDCNIEPETGGHEIPEQAIQA